MSYFNITGSVAIYFTSIATLKSTFNSDWAIIINTNRIANY